MRSMRILQAFTLGGVVIEALAIAWKAKLSDVLANSDLNGREKLPIGTLKEQSIMTNGIIIRRKKAMGVGRKSVTK